MNKNLLCLAMICALLSLASCSLFPFGLGTQTVPTTAPTPSGLPVTFGNISLVIPIGLASGASFSTSVDVEYPYLNPSFGDMPEHTVITLDGFSLQGKIPRILVFQADQFAQYTELTQKIISALQALPIQSNTDVPADLATTFFAQTKFLSSSNFYGIRYLTESLNGYSPINNADIFYYYQGLSLDKKYYSEALIPINATFLAPDSNPDSAFPAGGVPFSINSMGDATAVQNYYNSVKDKLNTADPAAFSPSLGLLDELVQSIQVTP
jgi:hypothetical protein